MSHKDDGAFDCFLLVVPEGDETGYQAICMVLDGVIRGGRPEMVDVGVVTESQDSGLWDFCRQ